MAARQAMVTLKVAGGSRQTTNSKKFKPRIARSPPNALVQTNERARQTDDVDFAHPALKTNLEFARRGPVRGERRAKRVMRGSGEPSGGAGDGEGPPGPAW